MTAPTQLRVPINTQTAASLASLAESGHDPADVVHRAVALYELVLAENAAGRAVQSVDEDGRVRRISLR